LKIDLSTLAPNFGASAGVALAPDGQSLFFNVPSSRNGGNNVNTIVRTGLSGNLIWSQAVNTIWNEDIDVVFQ